MNRAQLRQRLRGYLSEPVEGFWLDSELNGYLDTANINVNTTISHVINDYFNVPESFQTVVNAVSRSYVLPQGFRYLRRIAILESQGETPLVSLSFPYIEMQGGYLFTGKVGRPCFYHVRGGGIDLYPKPDAVYTIIGYFDLAHASFVDDTSVPLSPESYHDMVAMGAAVLAGFKDKSLNMTNIANAYAALEQTLVDEMEIRKYDGNEVFA